ncbi:YkgJ family cysteine cluster protein [Thermithiobacillus tepidarius]|uniref:YkgJ family cysteine cluster protein n=1 Tax=Thermithiobacillus tepidarius TaxID=929 RepID=UPI0038B424AE
MSRRWPAAIDGRRVPRRVHPCPAAFRQTPSASNRPMECRPHCGACCIALSISSPIPGMPGGKPAGVRCTQLTEDFRCAIFGHPERPKCCSGLQPSMEMCGSHREAALAWMAWLEEATRPED